MIVLSISFIVNALLLSLIVRAVIGGFFRRYAIFYFYLISVLSVSVFRLAVYTRQPDLYSHVYWSTEFVSLAVGYGIIWEIYTITLSDYPGARAMASSLIMGVFIVVVAKAFLTSTVDPSWFIASSVAELQRSLRIVQAFLLIAIIWLTTYYSIPVGRNLRGIIMGYGLTIGSALIFLSIRPHVAQLIPSLWQYLQPLTYLVSVFIWCATLWSYQPNPRPEAEFTMGRDYALLAQRTQRAIAGARESLLRVFFP